MKEELETAKLNFLGGADTYFQEIYKESNPYRELSRITSIFLGPNCCVFCLLHRDQSCKGCFYAERKKSCCSKSSSYTLAIDEVFRFNAVLRKHSFIAKDREQIIEMGIKLQRKMRDIGKANSAAEFMEIKAKLLKKIVRFWYDIYCKNLDTAEQYSRTLSALTRYWNKRDSIAYEKYQEAQKND